MRWMLSASPMKQPSQITLLETYCLGGPSNTHTLSLSNYSNLKGKDQNNQRSNPEKNIGNASSRRKHPKTLITILKNMRIYNILTVKIEFFFPFCPATQHAGSYFFHQECNSGPVSESEEF